MADTTVTGRIGDMDVALINAASEATLQKLVEQMSALSNKMGGSSSSGAGGQQSQATAVANTTTTFNKAGQAVGAFAGAVADATKGLLNFAGNLIGGTFLALKNLTTELLFGGSKITDFTKHLAALPSIFGTLGSVVHTVAQFFQEGVETFRSLSQVGAGFTGSLTDMRIMAAESGMTLDRFSKTVIANAESMALFGSSVSQGAQRFGKLSKDLRSSEAGERLMNMGFSIDEINETLITYANINSRMGRDRARSDSELIQRAAEFGEELNAAAAATGLSRKAIGDAANALSKDAVIGSIKQRLGGDKGREFETSISAFVAKFKESAPAALEVLSGFPNSPEAITFASQAPEMANTLAKLRKGQISGLEFQNAMVEAAQKRRDEILALSPAQLAARRAIPGFAQYEKSIMELAAANIMSAEQIKAEQERQKKAAAVDSAFKRFDDVIERFRASIALNILESAAFKAFEGSISNLIDNGPKMEQIGNLIIGALKTILVEIDKFIKTWQSSGFSAAFKQAFEKFVATIFDIGDENDPQRKRKDGTVMTVGETAVDKIADGILAGFKTLFVKMGEAAMEHSGTIAAAILATFIGYKALTSLGGSKDKGAGAVKPFSPLQSLGNSIASAAGILLNGVAIGASMIAIGKGLEFLAVGVKAFEGVSADALIAAGAGLAAITVAIKGFAALGPGLANPKAIAGIAIVELAIAGLGLALQQFPADLLRAFGDVIQKTFAGMSGILESTGAAIERVVDSITKMRLGVMDATTKQIKDLSDIPSEKITATADSIGKLKVALDGFAPGMFRGFSEMMGGLFASDKIGPLEKMAELGPKLSTAAPGFTAFREAISGGFSVTGLSLTPQQANSIALLTRDLPAYAEGLEAITKIAPNLQSTTTAMQAFIEASKDVNLDKFTFTKEQTASLVDGTNKLKNLATQLSNASKEFKKLDDTGLAKIKEGVEGLSKAFKDFNESFIEKFLPKFEQMKSTTQEGLLTEVGSKLDTLNTSMTALVGIERDSRGFLNTISTKSPGKIS